MSDVVVGNSVPSPRFVRGRPCIYNQAMVVALVQALADGKGITEASNSVGMNFRAGGTMLRRLRKIHSVTNTTHLVSHFLRNGWID